MNNNVNINCKFDGTNFKILYFGRLGRVKNQDFLKEVSSAFNKEDYVVVVINIVFVYFMIISVLTN